MAYGDDQTQVQSDIIWETGQGGYLNDENPKKVLVYLPYIGDSTQRGLGVSGEEEDTRGWGNYNDYN